MNLIVIFLLMTILLMMMITSIMLKITKSLTTMYYSQILTLVIFKKTPRSFITEVGAFKSKDILERYKRNTFSPYFGVDIIDINTLISLFHRGLDKIIKN